MGRVDDRVVIVTGSARGTGEATARLLASEGAHVVLGDVAEEAGRRVAGEIGDRARFQPLDVGSEASWQALVDAVLAEHGRVDALVNNAAVLHMAALDDTPLEVYERVVRVNQVGPFLGMKAVAPVMKQAGRGSIVNVSSIDGMTAKNGLVAYSASKWAVRGMTRVAALELGKFGIRVNAVCPEAGSADMIRPYLPEARMLRPGQEIEPGWYAVSVMVEQMVPAILAARPEDVYRYEDLRRGAELWRPFWQSVLERGEDHGWVAGTFHLYRLE